MGAEVVLKNHPHPERDILLDHQSVQQDQHFQLDPGRGQRNDSTGSSLASSHHWSDYTLTGSVSGQCSSNSWGMDEAVRFTEWYPAYVQCAFERGNF